MKNTIKTRFLGLFTIGLLVLGGCSSNYAGSQSSARTLPKIPEIRGHQRAKPKTYPKKAPAKPAVTSAAKVKKYSITSSSTTVITQKDVAAVQKEIANQEAIKLAAKKRMTVEVDPYAQIPENSTSSSGKLQPPAVPSSAVQSLMSRARADLAIGRTQSAVSKLERGLRIESQNANIWNLLAKAHYDQNDYQQSIAMAKKSIRYASEENLISQNWGLIKKAGEKSDDTIALKEALDYFKVNP